MGQPDDPYGRNVGQVPSVPAQPSPEPYYQRQQAAPSHGIGQPAPQQTHYPPEAYAQQRPPRRKRRVFLWVFLAIQALFVIWLITGLASVHTAPTAAQLAQGCYNHNWYPLFKSQADCVTHYGGALNAAGTAGKAIGAGLVVLLWVIVDVILGIGYGIYKLATR